MGRYLLECEIDPHDGGLCWLPLYLEAEGRADAAELAAEIIALLGTRFTVTRSTEPRPASRALQLKLTAYYAATDLRGRPRLLSLDDGHFRPTRRATPLVFDRRLSLAALPGRAHLEQVLPAMGTHRVPVRVVSSSADVLHHDVLVLALAPARADRSAA